eukprot:97304-Chlamydomonas_euryale.AAC.1
MMRLVDDFLFVTTSRAAAEAVVGRMHNGFPEYGLSINPQKTQLNFDMTLPGAAATNMHAADGGAEPEPRPRQCASPAATAPAAGRLLRNVWVDGAGRAFVRWCGLLLNACTMEVQADYTRYCGQHVATSLSVPLTQQPGAQLVMKMAQFMRPKVGGDSCGRSSGTRRGE